MAGDSRRGSIFSYVLAYLDLWHKTGLIGVLLFFSFPMRLAVDAFRGRLRVPAIAVPRGEASVVLAMRGPVLFTGSTNPYVLAAFGLFS